MEDKDIRDFWGNVIAQITHQSSKEFAFRSCLDNSSFRCCININATCSVSSTLSTCLLTTWQRTWDRLGARSEDEAYSCHVQRFRRDVGIAAAREFARYRLLRVPFIGVPRAVIRDRHAGRREARAVPAQGPMQADFFRHQADIWQAVAG